MTDIDRRTLLRAGAGAVLAGPLAGFAARAASGAPHRPPGLTELLPRPDLRDGEVRLALPRGLPLPLVPADRRGDGRRHPGARPPRRHGRVRPRARAQPLDAGAQPRDQRLRDGVLGVRADLRPRRDGGTTTALVTDDGRVRDSWASLAGTQMNCSGGRMPWGSWVTCEETVNGVDVYDDFTRGTLPPETYVVNAG